MLKLRREAVIKEAVKSDVDPKTCWINKMRKVCFSRKCHRVMGGKRMVLAEKASVANESNSKHLRKAPTCNGLTKSKVMGYGSRVLRKTPTCNGLTKLLKIYRRLGVMGEVCTKRFLDR